MITYVVNKVLSKKFIGWLGACLFLYIGKIDANTWLIITLTYMSVESALNIFDKFTKNKEVVNK
jgi:hypothetical protein